LNTPLLSINKLCVSVGEKEILRELDLTINAGETHILMGQNGSGKSTLASAIMGNPVYTVTGGQLLFNGEELRALPPDKRARLGIFLSFQNPEEIPGVSLENFVRTAKGAVTGTAPRIVAFRKELREHMAQLEMDSAYASRELNVGFSGGEKKKSEILQLIALDPKLAILDETDSGLDVDAIRIVKEGITRYRNENNALLIITHNAKLIEGLGITKVHVLENGRIGASGGTELIARISEGGFAAVQ
jgi:Fe-S cluster assembly ATP-binding protein